MKRLIFYVFSILIEFVLLLHICTFVKANDEDYLYFDVGNTLLDIIYQLDYFDDVSFFDSLNNQINSYYSLGKTGIKINCFNSDIQKSYHLVMNGDVTGDGNQDESDLSAIKNDIVQISHLENEFLAAGDKNKDSVISLYDLLMNKKEQSTSKPSTNEADDLPVKIALSDDNLSMEVNDVYSLSYKLFFDDNTNEDEPKENVIFISKDTNVAKVDRNGMITALANGETQIVAYTQGGSSASCSISVHTTPNEIHLNTDSINLFINGTDSSSLTVSYIPETSNRFTDITWESSNPKVVSVNESGNITAIANSNEPVAITATNEKGLKSICYVNVYTLPTELNIPDTCRLECLQTIKLSATLSPDTANYASTVSWSSNLKTVATVSEDGTVTGINPGTATITARTSNGLIARCNVTVYKVIKGIRLNQSSATIDLAKSKTFQILANADDGTEITRLMKWTCDSEDVANIDENGLITAISNGHANITGTIDNITEKFDLTVETSPSSLKLSKSVVILTVGKSEELTYKINPDTANVNNTVTWSISKTDSDKLSIDNNILTAKAAGIANIRASCPNNVFDDCLVIITNNAANMSFNESTVLIKKDTSKTLSLNFDFNLEDIDLDSLSISSEHDDIVYYTQNVEKESNIVNIEITGLKEGTDTITASIDDLSASCDVIVYADLPSINLYIGDTLVNNTKQRADLSRMGRTFNVSAKMADENYDISRLVTWESSDREVAYVTNLGEVILSKNSPLDTYITINAKIDDNIVASFELLVITSPTSISMQSDITLYINQTAEAMLTPNISPSTANIYTNITYESNANDVASVNDNGIITAKGPGVAIITATTSNQISTSCTVTVKTAPSSIKFSDNASSSYLRLNTSKTLSTIIEPANTNAYNTINWHSDDSNIVTVDTFGNISAKNAGITNITATTENGKSCQIQIIVPYFEASVGTSSLNLSSSSNNATDVIITNNSNIGNLSYYSNNPNVATVDNNGRITATGNGTTNIIVTESNANTSASVGITVITTTQSVGLNLSSYSLDITNTSVQLTATQSPSTISNKGLTWNSSNTSVATVDANGAVQRVSPGTTIITAKANDDSSKVATCTITVKQEKMIIAGASTVVQLASKMKCSAKANDYVKIYYYRDYGYKIRATESEHTEYYSHITNGHWGDTDQDADLFFVSKGGIGYYWMTATSPAGPFTSNGKNNNPKGITQIDTILQNNPSCHFTIAFMNGGNDLSVATSKEEVDTIAKTYADWYASLATQYPQHTVYVFPVPPVDESTASQSLKKRSYTETTSNNKKRQRFANVLNTQVINLNETHPNLKYAVGFYNDHRDANGSCSFSCYDGRHFTKTSAKYVFEQILTRSGVGTIVNNSFKRY